MSYSAYFDWYTSRGCELVPSRVNNPKKPPKNWRTLNYSNMQLETNLELGGGLLWRLGDTDLVIDVDLYKPGAVRPYNKLNEWFGGSASSMVPTVHTPRGGRHYYLRVPADIQLASSHAAFGSVEFKTVGSHVTCPPSPHLKAAGRYEFDYASPIGAHIPMAPLWLVELLTINPPEVIPDCPFWPDDTLELALAELPVSEYGSNDKWWPVLCASHYATGGLGFDIFADWSLSDPDYSHELSTVRARWDSLTAQSKPNYITHLSILKDIKTRLGHLPQALQDSLETRDFEILSNAADLTPAQTVLAPTAAITPVQMQQTVLPPQPDPVPPTATVPPAGEPDLKKRISDLNQAIAQLSPQSSTAEIMRCMEATATLDAVQISRFTALIAKHTGMPRPDVKKYVNQATKERYASRINLSERARTDAELGGEECPVPADLGHYLAELVLKDYYADGEHLIYTPEGRYWRYTGTHWVERSDARVEGDIHRSALRLRSELAAAASFTVSQLMSQASRIVKAIAASRGENYFRRLSPDPVINCLNGELWIDPDTGVHTLCRHTPASGLRSCLGIDYDPAAVCPWWDYALLGMFAPLENPRAVVDHLHELIGYTIQPYKNLAAWVLLYGKGNNGKSTVIDTVSALLGDAAMSVGLNSFVNQDHIYDAAANKLAIFEDDLKKGAELPDDVLKKLSENKEITANPKQRSYYRYRNVATVWVSTNHWPRTSDMSEGMRRRPYVIEFKRNFSSDGTVDHGIKQKICCGELSGVLNQALTGLIRLRARGNLCRPAACEESKKLWFEGTNQISRFCQDKVEFKEGGAVPLQTVYEVYRLWCEAEGIRRSYSRSGLEHELISGGRVVEVLRRSKHVRGVSIVSEW